MLHWTVSDQGFLKLDVCLSPQGPVAPGAASYSFPSTARISTDTTTRGSSRRRFGRTPRSARSPSRKYSEPGLVVQFRSHVIQRIVGFVRSETEALNVLPGSGFFRELTVTNGPPAVLTYVDDTPASRREVIASFYVLPAPSFARANRCAASSPHTSRTTGPSSRRAG